MSVGELLGGAAQDSRGGQLRFDQIKGSYPPVFEAKGSLFILLFIDLG
jgi:hypothetical protein